MTFNDQDRRRRKRLPRPIRLVIRIVVLVWALGFVLNRLSSLAPTSKPHPSTKRPSAAASSLLQSPSPSASVLVLPSPTGLRNGVPVGFPHTTDGAVAAVAFDVEAFDSLDAWAAQTWARTVAAPGDSNALAAQAAKGVAAIRAAAGLPSTGPADGSFITYLPRAYQVGDVSSDRAVVWVLAIESTSTGGSAAVEQSAVLGFVTVWAEGDWHLSAKDPGTPPPTDQPATAAAATDGWRALAESP